MARSFNGSTDKIATASAGAISGTAPLTMACWMKSTQNLAGGNTVFWTYEESGTPATFEKSLWGDGAAGQIGFFVFSGSSFYVIGTHNVFDGNWHHIAGYYDGTNIGIYKDGVSEATPVAASGTFAYTTPIWNFGNHTAGTINGLTPVAYNGSLAECCVWNVALTANEFAALAAGVNPFRIRPASIIGYFPFWGLQSPEPDLSGNAHNGTLTGTSLANHAPVTLFTKRARTEAEQLLLSSSSISVSPRSAISSSVSVTPAVSPSPISPSSVAAQSPASSSSVSSSGEPITPCTGYVQVCFLPSGS